MLLLEEESVCGQPSEVTVGPDLGGFSAVDLRREAPATMPLAKLLAAARESLTELVEVSRREVHRLDRIITQFLRAVRPTLPDRKPIEVARALNETLELMKHELANRRILSATR